MTFFCHKKAQKTQKSFQVEEPDVAFGCVSRVINKLPVRRDIDAAKVVFVRREYLAHAFGLHITEIEVAVEGKTKRVLSGSYIALLRARNVSSHFLILISR